MDRGGRVGALSSEMGLFQNGKVLMDWALLRILWALGCGVVLYWESAIVDGCGRVELSVDVESLREAVPVWHLK